MNKWVSMKDSSITAVVAVGGSGQIESSEYFWEQWRKIKGKKGGRHWSRACTLGWGPPLWPCSLVSRVLAVCVPLAAPLILEPRKDPLWGKEHWARFRAQGNPCRSRKTSEAAFNPHLSDRRGRWGCCIVLSEKSRQQDETIRVVNLPVRPLEVTNFPNYCLNKQGAAEAGFRLHVLQPGAGCAPSGWGPIPAQTQSSQSGDSGGTRMEGNPEGGTDRLLLDMGQEPGAARQRQGLKEHGQGCKGPNYCTLGLISHASKVTLKILQDRLQQYMNQELADGQAEFRKGRRTRD